MRYIRILVLGLFILTSVSYAGLKIYTEKTTDRTAPVLQCSSDILTVSVNSTESQLLQGITAEDDRDGDLSDEVVVEKIGPFLSDGTREISYAVCDNANNTGRVQRKIRYSDYEPPKFELEQPLRFESGKKINISEYLTVSDVLDGNLSSHIRQTYGETFTYQNKAGTYEIGCQAANSAGDVSQIDLLVEIIDAKDTASIPAVDMDQYVIYLKKGEDFNPADYADSVSIGSRSFDISNRNQKPAANSRKIKGLFGDLTNRTTSDDLIDTIDYNNIFVESSVDPSVPGSYLVQYHITTQDGYTGTTGLSVIVCE